MSFASGAYERFFSVRANHDVGDQSLYVTKNCQRSERFGVWLLRKNNKIKYLQLDVTIQLRRAKIWPAPGMDAYGDDFQSRKDVAL